MTTSRQRILDYLTAKVTASAQQISLALHMTPANARHHLAALRNEGIIQEAGFLPQEGRGRPVRLYCLTEPAARHNLDRLADSLIQILWEGKSAGERDHLLQQLAGDLAGEGTPGRSPTLRLNQAVQRLNELHYRAHWEAHVPAPKVILGHCPFRSIVERHPELCRMDALMLQRLLSAPVTQTAKLTPGAAGLPVCMFSLAARPAT